MARVLYIYLDTKSFSDKQFAIIFFHCMGCLFTSLVVFISRCTNVFNSNKINLFWLLVLLMSDLEKNCLIKILQIHLCSHLRMLYYYLLHVIFNPLCDVHIQVCSFACGYNVFSAPFGENTIVSTLISWQSCQKSVDCK